MSQKITLFLLFFVLLLAGCDSQKSRQANEQQNKSLFSMAKINSWYGAKREVKQEVSDTTSSLDSSSSLEVSLIESSSSVMNASSASKINGIEAKIDSFQLVVENASGSGFYKEGDSILVVPEDKLDSGLCFREWDVSNSISLKTDEDSDSVQVIMPKKSVTIKAVFRSCYDGLKTVTIGNLKWTTENMNIWTFSGSWCYDNKSNNCRRHGRLYDYETAKKVCRSGWRLPTDQEWNAMASAVGSEAGLKLKSREGWVAEGENNANGINAVGFGGLPAGIYYEGNFLYQGLYAYFWTATEVNSNMAWFRSLSYDNDEIYRHSNYKHVAYSVRCVQDI